jgi:hypothetical protein
MLNHKSIKYFKQAVNATSYKETNLDIACKCPICGDSTKKNNSKRLHLYKKGDLELINCFNAGCACENKTIYSFLRDFYPHLLPAYRKETFGDKIDNLRQNQTLGDLVQFGVGESIPTTDEPKPTLFDLSMFFEPLTSEYTDYLKSRGLVPHFNNTWYKGKENIKIGEITYNIKDYLIIPLICDKLCYGFYSRSIKEKDFITFVSTPGFKVWNWFDIDKKKPVYIFEAIFDGMSTGIQNIIANLGAKLPQERLDQLKDPIFCLDNDKTGIEMSIKYAEQGHKVFVMPSAFTEKDFNELKLNQPTLDIKKMIDDNTFKGISAITRLKAKL